MNHLSKIVSFFVFPFLVLLAHLIASKLLNLYAVFPNLDIPFHYIGGLSIAYVAAGILGYLRMEKIAAVPDGALSPVLIFSLTATATVFWEFAEFIGDQLLGTNIQISLANTMQDQFVGILGGMTWILMIYRRLQASES